MSEVKQLLSDVVEIARGAGELIMSFDPDCPSLKVQQKSDNSPVSSADHAANDFIQHKLAQLPCNFPVLSEESSVPEFQERSQWQSYWLLDPLDGTRGYLSGGEDFTVNIALVENGAPVLGVIYIPFRQTGYAAQSETGAFIIKPDTKEWQPITSRKYSKQITLSFSARRTSDAYRQFKVHLESAGFEISEIREGSSLKFCRVAEGVSDIYPCFLATHEWDTAAGQVIVEQAGGLVVEAETGLPLRYNRKRSLLNPSFLVIGDPLFASQVSHYFESGSES